MKYKIVIYSYGGTTQTLDQGLSYDEAYRICSSYGWIYDTGYLWDMGIEEDD